MKKTFKRRSTTAFAVEKSGNSKLGDCSTTYAHGESCPISCPFNHMNEGGCYGHTGPTHMQVLRLQKPKNTEEVAVDEAIAIMNLSGTRPLRLHTFGDCKTTETARIVAEAAEIFTEKKGKPVWTYTHGWKDKLGRIRVPREAWGTVSVLASCETPEHITKANAAGYATAITVPHFPDGSKVFKVGEHNVIPCPEMTGVKPDCRSCGLCFDDKNLLKKKLTIGFAIHGQQYKKALTALMVLNS